MKLYLYCVTKGLLVINPSFCSSPLCFYHFPLVITIYLMQDHFTNERNMAINMKYIGKFQHGIIFVLIFCFAYWKAMTLRPQLSIQLYPLRMSYKTSKILLTPPPSTRLSLWLVQFYLICHFYIKDNPGLKIWVFCHANFTTRKSSDMHKPYIPKCYIYDG